MLYPKCKVYSDGSHYIAIQYIPQKPRLKKDKKVKSLPPEMEVVEDEGPTPFDKFEQMSNECPAQIITASRLQPDSLYCVQKGMYG